MNTDPILAALDQSTQASIDQTRVAQALAGEVAGKMGQIDQRIAEKEQDVDELVSNKNRILNGSSIHIGLYSCGFVTPMGQAASIAPAASHAGIILWRMPKFDEGHRYHNIGLHGTCRSNRSGHQSYFETKVWIECGHDREFLYIDTGNGWESSGHGLGFSTIDIDGETYRVLTTQKSGGGHLTFEGMIRGNGGPYYDHTDSVRTEYAGRIVKRNEDGTFALQDSALSEFIRYAFKYEV